MDKYFKKSSLFGTAKEDIKSNVVESDSLKSNLEQSFVDLTLAEVKEEVMSRELDLDNVFTLLNPHSGGDESLAYAYSKFKAESELPSLYELSSVVLNFIAGLKLNDKEFVKWNHENLEWE